MAGRKDKSKAAALPKLNLEEEAAKTPKSVMEKVKKVRTEFWPVWSNPLLQRNYGVVSNLSFFPTFSRGIKRRRQRRR